MIVLLNGPLAIGKLTLGEALAESIDFGSRRSRYEV